MEKVIHFRSVIESFDNDEFNLFTKKLFATYNKRDLLIKSLFFILLNESIHARYNDIQQINKICKSITDLRRKKLKSKTKLIEKTNKKKKRKQNHFNMLPTAIISHTASYLKTAEQPQFMRCNRYIFISCSSTPSTIQNLTSKNWLKEYCKNYGQQFRRYQLRKLSKFRMAKQIRFDVLPWYISDNVNGWKWNNLNVLHIEHIRMDNCEFLANILQIIQVKQLRFGLISFSMNNEKTESEKKTLLNLLSINKNVQYIGFKYITKSTRNFDISFDLNLLKQTFNHLKGLEFTVGSIGTANNFCDQLLSALSQQIESLHLSNAYRGRMPLSSNNDIYYTNLKELCMERMDYRLISNILSTADKLKRIYWKFATGNIVPFEMNAEHQQIVLKHILTQLKQLTYLEIMTSFNERIFESIKQSFIQSIIKREDFKLMITLKESLDQNELGFIERNIEEIIDMIQGSVIKDFVFGLTITFNDDDGYKGLRNKLKVIHKKYSIQERSIENGRLIYISNTNNSMSGYNEKWMCQCQRCSVE